jgi:hypothetical protein
MPVGIQCFDTAGNLCVDITSRLAKIAGSVAVDPASSTRSVIVPAGGAPFFSFQPLTVWGFDNMDVSRPNFTISASVISWTWPAGAGSNNTQIKGTLFYGIY